MEEILASIRKIISEDQPDQGKPAARSETAAEPAAPESEVLDLTDEIRDDGSISPVSSQSMSSAIPPSRQFENDVQFESIDEPPEAAKSSESHMDPDDLISDSTRSAVGRVFESIEEEPAPMRMAASSAPAGGSVEAVFRRAIQDAFEPQLQHWVDAHSGEILERMKPLIREWMDQNLPSLIEGAVQREISRAVKHRRR